MMRRHQQLCGAPRNNLPINRLAEVCVRSGFLFLSIAFDMTDRDPATVDCFVVGAK